MKARIALPVLLFVFGLASASNAQDAQFVPADEVFMTEEFKVDLTDKLKEAAHENKPAVILFGKPDNPDLGQLYQELQEKSYENRDSLILVIDPDLEGKDSPLRKYIDEELQSKRGLNTAVFPLKIKKDGNLELGQPSFNQWGYRAGIADDITRNVHSLVGASLTPSAATTSTANPQQSGQLQPNLKRTIAAARQDLETAAANRGLDLKRIEVRMDIAGGSQDKTLFERRPDCRRLRSRDQNVDRDRNRKQQTVRCHPGEHPCGAHSAQSGQTKKH